MTQALHLHQLEVIQPARELAPHRSALQGVAQGLRHLRLVPPEIEVKEENSAPATMRPHLKETAVLLTSLRCQSEFPKPLPTGPQHRSELPVGHLAWKYWAP